jgi:hypothetical protein
VSDSNDTTLSDSASFEVLSEGLTRILEQDSVVFRLATQDGGDSDIIGTGVARLTTFQTLVAWIPLSQGQANRQIDKLKLRSAEHVAMYRRLPGFRPVVQYFSHGKRWTWFADDPRIAHPGRSRPGPRQDADPMFAFDVVSAADEVHGTGRPEGSIRLIASARRRLAGLGGLVRGRGEERDLVTVDVSGGAITRVALSSPRERRVLLIDEARGEWSIPAMPDGTLVRDIFKLCETPVDRSLDWGTVEERLVDLLRA